MPHLKIDFMTNKITDNEDYFLFKSEDINNEVILFYDTFSKELISRFKAFYEHQRFLEKAYGFEYGEQQTKTFITLALGKISNDNVLQECPTGRLIPNKTNKLGLFDYWLGFRNSNYMIEFKQNWVRINHKNDLFTQKCHKNIQDATNQIQLIRNKKIYCTQERLYGVSILFNPLWIKDNDKYELPSNDDLIDSLKDSIDNNVINVISGWRIGKDYKRIFEYRDNKDRRYIEKHLGFLMHGKITDYTMERMKHIN